MEVAMNKIVWTLLGFLLLPAVACAQSQGTDKRAVLRAELAELQAAGWHPASRATNYPDDLQAAQRAVAQKKAAQSAGGNSNSE
jgi:hypothetical protein